jgi:hypothetical protein
VVGRRWGRDGAAMGPRSGPRGTKEMIRRRRRRRRRRHPRRYRRASRTPRERLVVVVGAHGPRIRGSSCSRSLAGQYAQVEGLTAIRTPLGGSRFSQPGGDRSHRPILRSIRRLPPPPIRLNCFPTARSLGLQEARAGPRPRAPQPVRQPALRTRNLLNN